MEESVVTIEIHIPQSAYDCLKKHCMAYRREKHDPETGMTVIQPVFADPESYIENLVTDATWPIMEHFDHPAAVAKRKADEAARQAVRSAVGMRFSRKA